MSTFEPATGCSRGAEAVAGRIVDADPRRKVVVTGEITATAAVRVGCGPAYRCVLDDGTGHIDLLFVGRRHIPGIGVGTVCSVEGVAAADGSRLLLWNPLYVLRVRPAQGSPPKRSGPSIVGPVHRRAG